MFHQGSFPVAGTPSAVSDPQVRALLGKCAPGAIHFHSAGTTIFAEGDPSEALFLVEFGTVRICRLTADGRRQITSFCHAGDVFGLEAGDVHASTAESVDGAGIRTLHPSDEAGFARTLLALALRRFARIQAHLLLLGRRNANEKMASFLLELAERQGGDGVVHLPMQRADIADYLGLTFETVSRVLRVFKERGIVSLPSVDRIMVLDFDALDALVD